MQITPNDETPESIAAAKARQDLAARGLPFSEEHFLRHVRSGNSATVSLYLTAGVSPNTRLDGETALAASVNAGHFGVARVLLASGADPSGLVEVLEKRRKGKDAWERLSSLTGVFTFVGSLVIAGVGWYFTNAYNSRQLELAAAQSLRAQQNVEYQNRLAEMQTVERMIPHLTKDESSKRAALIAIGALATPKLAVQMAEAYGGEGSIDALAQLATAKATPVAPAVAALTNLAKVEQGDAKPAHDALARVLAGKEKAIVKLRMGGRTACNAFVVDGNRGWIATPRYCIQDGDASSLSIQFEDSSPVPVRSVVLSQDGHIALLKTDKVGVPEIRLSKLTLNSGSTVTQLAVDLARDQMSVSFGRVVEVGPMEFATFIGGQSGKARAPGLKVKLSAEGDAPAGAGGSPLLDSEGNAACMTFQGTADRLEQCISVAAISEAIKSLPN